MTRVGVIEPSSSNWASPIVLVNKKDGSVLNGSHADQTGVCSPEGSLVAPDLDVVPVASPGSPAPGSDDGPVETCDSVESSPGTQSAPDGTALSSPPSKPTSPTWEELGVSLRILLGQYQEGGHPYIAEVQEKADNYERLLAQYKCRPYTEECSTLASSSCTVSLMLPPSAAFIADTSTADMSLTADAPTPIEALMDDVQNPGMLLSADTSTSSESLTADSSNPEASLLSSGPTPEAFLPSTAFLPLPLKNLFPRVPLPLESPFPRVPLPLECLFPQVSLLLLRPFPAVPLRRLLLSQMLLSGRQITLIPPLPRSFAILVLLDTTECPLDLSVHPEKTHASTTVGRVLVGKTARWEAYRHPGDDCSSAIPISPSIAWPKLAAAISPVHYDNLKKSPHEFRSLQNDPALFFLGAPSHYLADFQARQLADIRERARHGHSYLGVRHTPVGVHSIRCKEKAILPDGTIYECQSTWIEDPRPKTKLCTRTQARGSHIDRDIARVSSDSSNWI